MQLALTCCMRTPPIPRIPNRSAPLVAWRVGLIFGEAVLIPTSLIQVRCYHLETLFRLRKESSSGGQNSNICLSSITVKQRKHDVHTPYSGWLALHFEQYPLWNHIDGYESSATWRNCHWGLRCRPVFVLAKGAAGGKSATNCRNQL